MRLHREGHPGGNLFDHTFHDRLSYGFSLVAAPGLGTEIWERAGFPWRSAGTGFANFAGVHRDDASSAVSEAGRLRPSDSCAGTNSWAH